MAGHGSEGVTFAHRDSRATTGSDLPTPGLDRAAREALEQAELVPGATHAEGSGNRARPEEPDPWRTCFERDRDRILHASSFRRLAGKTQVFVFPDDHQRTRLTHALEVAQVATGIARACRLNVALTEAIALGHDCGHGPGGHASEDALSPFVIGGFDHAPWGADVSLASLNLCEETLDGIRNHSWSRPAPATPEGEVVSWADRVAYVCHDFEDAVRSGIVTPAALPAIVRERCGDRRGRQLGTFIDALVETTLRTGRVGMADAQAEALSAFRASNYEHIYLRPSSVAQGRAVVDVLQALVEHFGDRPHLLPTAGSGGRWAHRGRAGSRPRRGRLRGRHDRSVRVQPGRRPARVGPGQAAGGDRGDRQVLKGPSDRRPTGSSTQLLTHVTPNPVPPGRAPMRTPSRSCPSCSWS